MNRFTVTLLSFILCTWGSFAEGANQVSSKQPLVLTLEKSLEIALGQNRDVSIAEQDRYKADAQIGEAYSGALPQVSFSTMYTRNVQKPVLFLPANTPGLNPTNFTKSFEIGSNNAYQMGVQIAQPIFSRKVGVALEIAETFGKLSDESYRGTQQTVAFNVKKSFYAVLLMQKLVEANRQALEVVKANVDNLQALFNKGNAAEFDLLRAQVQLANTEPIFISTENSLVLSKYALKNLLSLPLDQEIQLQGDLSFEQLPAASMEETAKNAIAVHPLIAQLALQEAMLDKNIAIEKAGYYPTVALVGGYQWQAQDNTYSFSEYNWAKIMTLSLSVSYTLFDGFRTGEKVQQASIEKEKIRYTRLKAEEGLRIQIQSAELKMDEAKRRIEGQERNVDQAKKAVRISQTRFKSGVGTQLELLDSQVAMTRTQTNYAQAMYDYLIARAEWQYAVGVMQ